MPALTYPAVGSMLDRYLLEKELGIGGMGKVFLARDTRLNRKVAIKIPKLLLLADEGDAKDLLRRFEREALVAAGVRHPNICTIYDFDVLNGWPCLVMEYIEGVPLSDRVGAGRLWEPAKAVELAHIVAKAMGKVHEVGVIHRDLKPSNIMLEVDRPVVMDFGLARPEDPNMLLTMPGKAMGTPAYMSLEQWRGRSKEIGPSADVYSLGVILYEMLTGQRPFPSKDQTELMFQLMTSQATPPSRLRGGLDPALDPICLKAVANQAENRYADMRLFAEDLKKWLNSAQKTEEFSGPRDQGFDENETCRSLANQKADASGNGEAAIVAGPTPSTVLPWKTATSLSKPPGRGWKWLAAVVVLMAVAAAGYGLIKYDVWPMLSHIGERTVAMFGNSPTTQVEPSGNGAGSHNKETKTEPSKEKAAPPVVAVRPAPLKWPFTAVEAKAAQAAWAKALGVKVEIENSVGMHLRLIPPGEIQMGSPETEPGRDKDETLHTARQTRPFYVDVHEVTQGQYLQVMKRNPSQFQKTKEGAGGERLPVEMVSWFDAVVFCNRLSELEKLGICYRIEDIQEQEGSVAFAKVTPVDGRGYRLLTEAEWEYACRAGSKEAFSTGGSLKPADANFVESKIGQAVPVGQYPANAFGLYDMHGNVWEWVENWFGPYGMEEENPKGPDEGSARVFRGGSWYDPAARCRSAFRYGHSQESRFRYLGFRVARGSQ